MKKEISVLLALALCLTLCAGAAWAEEPEGLVYALCAPSCAIETDSGALLVTDVYNKCVWLVEDGQAALFAGGESPRDRYEEPMGGYNDGELTNSLFKEPWAIAPFLDGWAVSDAGNNALRLITEKGVQTINGRTKEPFIEVSDMGVVYDRPTGLAADEEGNLYVSNTDGGAIYRITPKGQVVSFCRDLISPMGLCWHDGALYVAEAGAHRVVKITEGKLQVVAGTGEEGFADGPADEARFSWPSGVAVDGTGAVYVADTANSAVRRIKKGEVETVLRPDEKEKSTFPISPRSVLLLDEGTMLVCDPYAQIMRPVQR